MVKLCGAEVRFHHQEVRLVERFGMKILEGKKCRYCDCGEWKKIVITKRKDWFGLERFRGYECNVCGKIIETQERVW